MKDPYEMYEKAYEKFFAKIRKTNFSKIFEDILDRDSPPDPIDVVTDEEYAKELFNEFYKKLSESLEYLEDDIDKVFDALKEFKEEFNEIVK